MEQENKKDNENAKDKSEISNEISKPDIKQINVSFSPDEYIDITNLCKKFKVKSVSGFIKECFYNGLESTVNKKTKLDKLLKGIPIDSEK